MANPQTENGYTKIANELLEALCKVRIPGEARQVLDVIFRKTYGFNKKEDAIALSQLCLMTGLKKPNVCRAINVLTGMNIVIKNDNGVTTKYRIIKNFETWKPLSKKITLSKKIMVVIKNDNKPLSKKIHTKEKKETITKESTSASAAASPPVEKIDHDMTFAQFWSVYPRKEQKKKTFDIWKKNKYGQHIDTIYKFILAAKETDRWKKGYIKQPPAFLNGECWNDDLATYRDRAEVGREILTTITHYD